MNSYIFYKLIIYLARTHLNWSKVTFIGAITKLLNSTIDKDNKCYLSTRPSNENVNGHVTLKTEKIQICYHISKLHFKLLYTISVGGIGVCLEWSRAALWSCAVESRWAEDEWTNTEGSADAPDDWRRETRLHLPAGTQESSTNTDTPQHTHGKHITHLQTA